MPGALSGHDALRLRVEIDGTVHTQADPRGLEAIEVEDHLELIGLARLTFALGDRRFHAPAFGAPVRLLLGETTEALFVGIVTGLRRVRCHGREQVTVVAMDARATLAASCRTRAWQDLSDARVAREVLGDLAGRVDETDGIHVHVLQRNESDLALLRRLAARSDRVLLARQGRLDFVRLPCGDRPLTLADAEVEELDVQVSPLEVPPSLTVRGWDPLAGEVVEGVAGVGELSRIGAGRPATDVARDVWGEGATLTEVLVERQSEARRLAAAELGRLARTLVRGTATLVGRADVRAGVTVRLGTSREGFGVEALVVASTHAFDVGRAYTTTIRFCSDTLPT